MAAIWLELARDARKAANMLVDDGHHRSAVARAYYAVYSKVTHGLTATAGLTMAAGREGPSHNGRHGIRPLVEGSMPNMNQARRDKLSELVGRLYTMRIDADYKPSARVEAREAREAISIMRTVFESF